jgi:hypothetical protein
MDVRDAIVEMEFDQSICILGGGMARFISYFGVCFDFARF